MSKALTISPDLSLPRDIGTETIAVLGRRGSGKSNTGTVIIEQLAAAGQQFVLIDPKGEGWGLKARGAGGPGIDVIVFGEPEGDLPLREEHGETLAEFVVKSGRSVVLSLAGIDSDAAARRFVARFAERLYTLKKKPENHGPLMVVIEEAHLFVPQRVEGAQADVVSRLQRLVRQGRSMGIGVTLIDQRPASVNKDVLTQLELLICHQLTSPHDRKAIDAWIEANAEADQAAEFRKTLPTLQPGEAWIWSPAKLKLFVRVKVNPRATFDSGATPILGKDAAKRPAMRDVNLDDLRGELERVVEEKKANDPAELKKKLAAAEKEVAGLRSAVEAEKTTAPPPAKVETKTVEKHIVTDKQLERLSAAQDRIEKRAEKFFEQLRPIVNALNDVLFGERDHIVELRKAVADLAARASAGIPPAPASLSQARRFGIETRKDTPLPAADWPGRPYDDGQTWTVESRAAYEASLAARPKALTTSNNAPSDLPKGEQAVLTAVAQTPGGCTREQITILTGYKRSTRDAYVQRAREKGLVDQNGDQIIATQAGIDALGSNFRPLPTGDALRAYWLDKLPEGERKCLAVVVDAYPAVVSRDTVTEATDYKRSTRDAYLQRLATRKLILSASNGVIASAHLFDGGTR